VPLLLDRLAEVCTRLETAPALPCVDSSCGGVSMRLRDIMTTDVATVKAGDSLQKARTSMGLRGVHHLVVVDGRTVIGIVTDAMIRWGEAQDMGCVQDVMLSQPVTAGPETTVREAANLLRGRVASVLPVVNEQEHLVGIVTVSDFLDLIGQGGERPVARATRWTPRRREPGSRASR
jgi:CBS domain-containing protein